MRGSVLDVIADKVLGVRAGDVMGVVSIVSLAASISAMTIAGPRVYYAMARDGVSSAPAARVHERYQHAAVSIVAQAIWSGVLVVSGGADRADPLHRIRGGPVFGCGGGGAVRAAQLRDARAPGTFSALGYPVAPGSTSSSRRCSSCSTRYAATRGRQARGVLIILAGVPLCSAALATSESLSNAFSDSLPHLAHLPYLPRLALTFALPALLLNARSLHPFRASRDRGCPARRAADPAARFPTPRR